MVDRDLKDIANAIRHNTTETTRSMEKIAKVFDDIKRELSKINNPNYGKIVKRTPILEDPVPVVLDWEIPTIIGSAELIKLENGLTQIMITIDPEDTERLDRMIKEGFVQGLQLSSMDPE